MAFIISGEEFERRLQRISQLRDLCIGLRYAVLNAWEKDEIPFKPNIDIRSDYEYWAAKAREKGVDISNS